MSGEFPASVAVTRRDVMRGVALLVAGGIGGFLVARNSGAARAGGSSASAANGYGYSPPKKQGQPKRLVALDRVPVDGGVVIGSANVVVTRDSGGAVHAFSAVCTHQGCTVSSVRGGVIDCPCHGSRFNASTGAVVRGPASRPLPAVAVTVDGGVVYAR